MNDEFVTPEDAEPKSNRRVIIIGVVVFVLVCCCCATLVAAWQYGDLIVDALGI